MQSKISSVTFEFKNEERAKEALIMLIVDCLLKNSKFQNSKEAEHEQ